MRRALLTLVLVSSIAQFVNAQGLYFDVGLGFGFARTIINAIDIKSILAGTTREIGVDLGLKLGAGPLYSVPIYLAFEFSGIGHRFEDDHNFIQFNTYLYGPSIMIYPFGNLQMGVALGPSFVANSTDLPIVMYKSIAGFAGNIHAALDLGNDSHALLLGLRYSWANNTLENSGALQSTSLFSLFVKYAFRKRFDQAVEAQQETAQ